MTVKTANIKAWHAVNLGILVVTVVLCLVFKWYLNSTAAFVGTAVVGVLVYFAFAMMGQKMFSGTTEFEFSGNSMTYKKGGKSVTIPFSTFQSLACKNLTYSYNNLYPIGYRIRLVTTMGTFYFESEFAMRRQFSDLELYPIYEKLTKVIEKINKKKK